MVKPYLIVSPLNISYIIGALPISYIMAKMLRGIDIRKYGSGNVGATNLMRVVGKGPGTIALFLDAAKGFIPVVIIAQIFYNPNIGISQPLFKVLLGVCAVSGHIWTIFLKFKGGKGVATTIGVFLGLAPLTTIFGLLIWLITALICRYVSLASIMMALSLPFLMVFFGHPREYIIASAIIFIFITFKHLPNIKKIVNKTEYKIGEKAKTDK
jgi:glycerol-3-phosphate acyltransferase PlsY